MRDMPSPGNSGPDGDDHPILPWRIVAGAFLHFAVPAYLVTVPLACLFAAPAPATAADMLALAVPFSGWFLSIYAIAGLGVSLAAALIDPMLRRIRLRRAARDPLIASRRSEQKAARALADGRRLYGSAVPPALDRLSATRWDHGDPRCQALAADLAEVMRTSTAAMASAPPERRAAILGMVTTALERIEHAVATLQAERARLDEGDALTVARYVEFRYGSSDFTGDRS